MQKNFIVTLKVFDRTPFKYMSNKTFLSDNNTPDTINVTGLDSRIYGELPFWKYILTQMEFDDFASLHHYRRKMNFVQEQICIPKPMLFGCSLADQMAAYHSPILVDAMSKALNSDILYKTNVFVPYNIFCAPKEVVENWINFCFGVVDSTMGILNLRGKTYEEILEFVKNNDSFKECNNKEKNLDPIYQARIGAFLLERANSIFWMHVCPYNYIPCEISLLEQGQKI